jgi:hypothetical protein
LHEKLGHPSEELTIKTAKRMGAKLKIKKGKCVACALAKSRKKNIKKEFIKVYYSRREAIRGHKFGQNQE